MPVNSSYSLSSSCVELSPSATGSYTRFPTQEPSLPVSATSDKSIVRVSFSVSNEPDNQAKDRHESEIVCFLRIGEGGLEISYSHHIIRVRETTIGPFTQEMERRMSLTPALTAVIQAGVFYEFWSAFARIVRTSPTRMGKLPTDTDPVPLDPRLA